MSTASSLYGHIATQTSDFTTALKCPLFPHVTHQHTQSLFTGRALAQLSEINSLHPGQPKSTGHTVNMQNIKCVVVGSLSPLLFIVFVDEITFLSFG